MRVCHFVDMRPNKKGPVELQLLEMTRRLSETGSFQSLYFTGQVPDWYTADVQRAGGSVRQLSGWDQIVDVGMAERADVAHLHFGGHAGASRLRKAGIAVVRTEHSYRPRRQFESGRRVIRRWRARQVDAFIAVSNYVKNQTVRDFKVDPRRVHTIYNGVDPARFVRPRADRLRLRMELFGVSDDRPVVTVAAHLSPHKRQNLLIAAMPELRRLVPDVTLVIAGGGSAEPQYRQQAAALGVEECIRFLVSEQNDVSAIYGASDIGVLTSAGEGLGVGAIEAMASGLPTLVTPCGGLAEVVVPGVTGDYFLDTSPMGITKVLLPYCRDASLRSAVGAEARNRVLQAFRLDRAVTETLALYELLLDGEAGCGVGVGPVEVG